MVSTFAIDNTKQYPVVAGSYCKRISVQEDFDASSPPTVNLREYQPTTGNGPIKLPIGGVAIYNQVGDSRFYPGQIVGYIETASGSATMQQTESEEV